MRLAEALTTVRRTRRSGAEKYFDLVCGFQALHLSTFLEAELLSRSVSGSLLVRTGLFGDLEGNIERAILNPGEALIVVITWPDLDPRLGIRWEADWREASIREVVASARTRLARVATLVNAAAQRTRTVIVPPGSALPLLFHESPDRLGETELLLQGLVTDFSLSCRQAAGVHLVRPLQESADHDVRLDVAAGFPFSVRGASKLAERIAPAALGSHPLKGLITDLDNTMWLGLIGDDGVDQVSWQGEKARAFGLYQQTLDSLLDAGFLVGVATRNDPAVARAALSRKDLLVRAHLLHPVEAGWGAKSAAVSRILSTWNVGADSVAFVDDDPRELAEAGRVWPKLTLLQSPGGDPENMLSLLLTLRRAFHRDRIGEEDRLRSASITLAPKAVGTTGVDDFHREEAGQMTVSLVRGRSDMRALELINKTNQFNLNGVRISEAEWIQLLAAYPKVRILVFGYSNRFGKLGRIAAVVLSEESGKVRVSSFVLSCRAFARRIEFAMLALLFEKAGRKDIDFVFAPTERNEALRWFFQGLVGALPPAGETLSLSWEAFRSNAPTIVIEVEEVDTWKTEENN